MFSGCAGCPLDPNNQFAQGFMLLGVGVSTVGGGPEWVHGSVRCHGSPTGLVGPSGPYDCGGMLKLKFMNA